MQMLQQLHSVAGMNSLWHVLKNAVFELKTGLGLGPPHWAATLIFQVDGGTSGGGIQAVMQDGLLWGVPKKRRTVEKRLARRFGVPNFPDSCRILRRRDDLVVCERCGHHHEYYALCANCYSVVRAETERIRAAIAGMDGPLAVRYQEEPAPEPEPGRQPPATVRLEGPRPRWWFARNLMTPSAGSYVPPHDPIKKE